MTRRVVIVGGGIAGLTTAYFLRRATPNPADLEIRGIEADRRLGGSLYTERGDGFLVEAGADSVLTTHPAGVRLVRELDLLGRLVGVPRDRRRTYALHGGSLVPLPEGFRMVAPPRLGPLLRTPLLTWRGKVRAAEDLVRARRRESGDESLTAFVRRRLGAEVLDQIAAPMVSGIHAGDPDHTSMDAILPQFVAYEREHGSVIRGLRAEMKRAPSPDPSVPTPFASFRDGMSELAEALVQRTPEVFWRTGAAAEQVERTRGGGFEVGLDDGELLQADAVVLATPAHVSANLVQPLHLGLAQDLRSIRATSSAVVSLAFPESSARPFNGTGFLVPRTERLRLKACTWTSSKFPGRAPPGHVLLRAFYGGAGDEGVLDLSDEGLTSLALRELEGPLGLRGQPERVRVHRWRAAHPQYEVGHRDRVAAIENLVASLPGLYLTGSSYRGIGIPYCIQDADRTAAAVLGFLHMEMPAAEAIA